MMEWEFHTPPQEDFNINWDAGKRFILVQVLNTIELVTGGEFRPVGKIVIQTDPGRLKVAGARVVWPKEQELEVLSKRGFTRVEVLAPGRYTALYLKLE